jgi:hypothetical protein
MARRFNGKPTLVASIAAAIRQNLNAAGEAADRIMAGTPAPGDLAVLRTGEKCIALLRQKAVS